MARLVHKYAEYSEAFTEETGDTPLGNDSDDNSASVVARRVEFPLSTSTYTVRRRRYVLYLNKRDFLPYVFDSASLRVLLHHVTLICVRSPEHIFGHWADQANNTPTVP